MTVCPMTERPHQSDRREAGFTLVEIAIVVATSAVIAGIIIQTISLLTSGQTATRNRLRATSIAERMANRIRQDLDYAVRVYKQGASPNMLAKLGLPSAAYLSGSRLPVASNIGYFDKDPTTQIQTGNLLVIARRVGKVVLDLSSVKADLRHRVDCFRFVVWYASADKDGGLDLNRWASTQVARYKDVTGEGDATKEQAIIADLRQRGITYAWDPSSSALGLHRISPILDSYQPLGLTDLVPADPRVVDLGLLIQRHVEIAPNGTRTPLPVPFFAKDNGGFPHGFEIKIDGDAAGMLVLVRLALRTRGSGSIGHAVAIREVAFRES